MHLCRGLSTSLLMKNKICTANSLFFCLCQLHSLSFNTITLMRSVRARVHTFVNPVIVRKHSIFTRNGRQTYANARKTVAFLQIKFNIIVMRAHFTSQHFLEPIVFCHLQSLYLCDRIIRRETLRK